MSVGFSRLAPLLSFLWLLLASAAPLTVCGAARAGGAEPLEIVTATGAHAFQVEIADTYERRMRGLMHRQSMPADHGMLFNFKIVAPVSMWMKNTFIPLDMVFVSRRGEVTAVATDAEPMSERIISSGGPVYAVIELNAGAARRIGLAAGDKVRHRFFDK